LTSIGEEVKVSYEAFDYRRLREQLQNPSLLFVAHRREILSQSLSAVDRKH